MREEEVVLSVISLMVFAGIAVLWMAMQSRRRIREMEHRERLAMIEHGVVPAPERDPVAFEQRMGLPPTPAKAARMRSAGIVMIGLGLALMVLLTFTVRSPDIGFGVGGAFAMLGAAFLVNSMLSARDEPYLPPPSPRRYPPSAPHPPPHAPERPTNLGP